MSFEAGQIISQSSREYTSAAIWCNNGNGELTDLGNATSRIDAMPVQPILTLHEQAMQLSMSKLDFVEIAEALTASMPNPVTWVSINEWMTTNPEIEKLFILATEVKRSDPKLDEVTTMFGEEFLPFLDMMFVYQNEIKSEIAAAKEDNRAINLATYVTQSIT